jgi:Bifunctional DNA primase/polymerase, N-terminal
LPSQSFQGRATELTKLGIPVVPVRVGTKRPDPDLAPHGAKDGTTKPGDIAIWNKESPDAGVAACAIGDFFFLDDDDAASLRT